MHTTPRFRERNLSFLYSVVSISPKPCESSREIFFILQIQRLNLRALKRLAQGYFPRPCRGGRWDSHPGSSDSKVARGWGERPVRTGGRLEPAEPSEGERGRPLQPSPRAGGAAPAPDSGRRLAAASEPRGAATRGSRGLGRAKRAAGWAEEAGASAAACGVGAVASAVRAPLAGSLRPGRTVETDAAAPWSRCPLPVLSCSPRS